MASDPAELGEEMSPRSWAAEMRGSVAMSSLDMVCRWRARQRSPMLGKKLRLGANELREGGRKGRVSTVSTCCWRTDSWAFPLHESTNKEVLQFDESVVFGLAHLDD